MAKAQTKARSPAQVQEEQFPVSFDVRIYPVKDSNIPLPMPMWISTVFSPFAA